MAEVDAGAPAPVEAVPAAPAAPAPDATAAPGGPTPEVETSPEAPKLSLTQKELDEIVEKRVARASRKGERETRAEMERRVRAETELEMLRKHSGERQPQPSGEPMFDDYQSKGKSPQDWVRDWTKWQRQQDDQAATTERSTREREQIVKDEGEYIRKGLDKASEKFADLGDRLTDLPKLSRPMLDFVIETEHGPAVGDFLANNPAEAEKIAEMRPAQQILAMASIASKLTAPPKPSAAPPPIVPNSGSGSAPKGYRPDMTDKEYKAWRERQIAQRNS